MPLTRLTLKLALIPTLIFAALISLIRAQPYDDSELREFLTPPQGCPAPCFMGIRPGVTTVDEAVAILERHEWVGQIAFSNYRNMTWMWNGKQPSILTNNISGGSIVFNNELVDLVTVSTSFQLGYIALALPSEHYLLVPNMDRDLMVQINDWQNNIQFGATIVCPYYHNFWKYKIKIYISNYDISPSGVAISSVNADVLDTNNTYCKN